jgi:adenosine/AMP kinase
MAKIVAVSNTPMAPTGYATQIAQLGLRALTAGHDFSVAANYGSPVNMEWNGIKIHAEGLLKYANDSGPVNIALAARDGGFG